VQGETIGDHCESLLEEFERADRYDLSAEDIEGAEAEWCHFEARCFTFVHQTSAPLSCFTARGRG
jgi:hypothetical protein